MTVMMMTSDDDGSGDEITGDLFPTKSRLSHDKPTAGYPMVGDHICTVYECVGLTRNSLYTTITNTAKQPLMMSMSAVFKKLLKYYHTVRKFYIILENR